MIDSPAAISPTEMAVTLHELRLVNRWLGGTSACLDEVKPWIERIARQQGANQPVRVLDFGSGSADIPEAIVRWSRRKGLLVRVTAVDFNFAVCQVAKRRLSSMPEIDVVQGDVLQPPIQRRAFDIVLCSAFLHHFSDAQIPSILRDLQEQAKRVVSINDLHRHRLAYAGIRLLTALLSRSQAVRHDGPLSVLKGFRRRELEELLRQSGADAGRIRRRWAFRWVITIGHGGLGIGD